MLLKYIHIFWKSRGVRPHRPVALHPFSSSGLNRNTQLCRRIAKESPLRICIACNPSSTPTQARLLTLSSSLPCVPSSGPSSPTCGQIFPSITVWMLLTSHFTFYSSLVCKTERLPEPVSYYHCWKRHTMNA